MTVAFERTLRALQADRSWAATVGLVLTALLLCGWAAWLALAKVTVYEVSNRATLEAPTAAHPVASRVEGRVVSARLELGRQVAANEVLVELDAQAERLALKEAQAQLAGLHAQAEAIESQMRADRNGLEAYRKSSGVAIDQARVRAGEGKARAAFDEEQAKARKGLADSHFISSEALRQARAQAEQSQASVNALELEAVKLEREAAVNSDDREAQIAALAKTLAEIQGNASAREATIARLNNDIEQRRIYAPVAGRLGMVEPLRAGAIVRDGEVLASIVPEGATRAVAFFPIASVGRLRAGQPARLRLDGFPSTQYGTLPAKVASVGNEAVDGHVRAELELEPATVRTIPIEHGLSGIAEVEVENASPLDLVLRAIGRWLTTRQSGA
jgi:multidrug resistance efflux pump